MTVRMPKNLVLVAPQWGRKSRNFQTLNLNYSANHMTYTAKLGYNDAEFQQLSEKYHLKLNSSVLMEILKENP